MTRDTDVCDGCGNFYPYDEGTDNESRERFCRSCQALFEREQEQRDAENQTLLDAQ
jgi:hypothetical protein